MAKDPDDAPFGVEGASQSRPFTLLARLPCSPEGPRDRPVGGNDLSAANFSDDFVKNGDA
jgi:hypothetical protein